MTIIMNMSGYISYQNLNFFKVKTLFENINSIEFDVNGDYKEYSRKRNEANKDYRDYIKKS